MIEPLDVESSEGIHLIGELRGPTEAPLVMLMHGGGQTRHAWSGTVRRLLDDGYRVGAYDARGHGDSGWSPGGDYTMPAHAADLATVLRAIGRPAALVGASMGGISSLITASEHPELVRALVLVDIVPGYAAPGVQRIRDFMMANPDGFATLEEAVAAVQAYNPNRPPSKSPDGLMRSLRERDGRLYWHWDPTVIAAPPDPDMPRTLNARLEALSPTLPLLLVAGANSDVVDEAATATFRSHAPQAEIVAVGGAGHMVAGDRNDAFGTAISDFLGRTLHGMADSD